MYSHAPQALREGLKALPIRPGDEVLVPAYHHGFEVGELLRAGLATPFYEADETLEPDGEELAELLTERTRALYLIHYLGFPQDGARWRRWCDERGLLLIEDATQAWLASVDRAPVGSFGHVAVFGLSSTFGLPDGTALLGVPESPEGYPCCIGVSGLVRRHGAWMLARSSALGELGRALSHQGWHPDSARVTLSARLHGASRATRFLLPRVADTGVAAQRRANYAMLLEELGELVPAPFDTLPPAASPYALPVESVDKAELLDRLARRGVLGLDLWPVPHAALPAGRFPGAARRRERLVALPVHQELRLRDVQRVAAGIAPRTHARPPTLELEHVHTLETLREEWNALAKRADNVFATWEWVSTWWRHFGQDRRLFVTACRSREGRLVGVIPLYFWTSRPLRILRFLGHGAADQLGPICAPEDRLAVARALRSLLRRPSTRWDVFLADLIPGDEGWGTLLDARIVSRTRSPVLQGDGRGWEAFLSSRSANFRQQVRRRERNLAREHDLRYRLSAEPSRLEEDIDTLFALHSDRWSRADSSFTVLQAFHREFATLAAKQGWLRLWFLELDGDSVAAWYGFRFAGAESYYQAGWRPAWQRSSVGFVLLSHSIREALNDGLREYRFLQGDEAYKYRFANRDDELHTLAVPGNVVGRAAVTAELAARRWPVLHRATGAARATRLGQAS